LPARFRLAVTDETTCRRLQLGAVWLCSGRLCLPEWLGAEAGAVVVITTLFADASGAQLDGQPAVSLSPHALGRWRERSRRAAVRDLLHDLEPLVTSPDPPPWPCQTGQWRGEDALGDGVPIRLVRTFIDR
jgi:hypothetical protein